MGIVEFISELIIAMIRGSGYFGIFIAMAIESACLPFPSEVIMPFAGFVVSEGKMTLSGITLAGALGNLFGSLIAYVIGIAGGRPFLEKYGKYVLISRHKLELADNWFKKYGDRAVLLSRVLPIIRTFISLPAGIARMEIKKFIAYTFIGSIPWCLFLGYLGVLLGPKWHILRRYFYILDILVIAAAVGLIIYAISRTKGKRVRPGN